MAINDTSDHWGRVLVNAFDTVLGVRTELKASGRDLDSTGSTIHDEDFQSIKAKVADGTNSSIGVKDQ